MKRYLLTVILSASATASAATIENVTPAGAKLGDSIVSGSGCLSDSSKIRVHKNLNRFILRTPDYFADASDNHLSRSTCNFAIEIDVPLGFQVGMSPLNYRGSVYVPQGGVADFKVDSFISGTLTSDNDEQVWDNERSYSIDEAFNANDSEAERVVIWSKCNEKTSVIRVNTSLKAFKGKSHGTEINVSLLSARLKWKAC